MAYPEPTEVSPWYLRNITQALALDETSGNVYGEKFATVPFDPQNPTDSIGLARHFKLS